MYTCYFKDNNNFDIIKKKVLDSILESDILNDYCFNDSTELVVTNDYFRLILKKTDKLIINWKNECDIDINYDLWFEDYYFEGGYSAISKIVEVIGRLLKKTSEDLLVYSNDLACILRKNNEVIVDDSCFIYPTEEKFPFGSLMVEYDYGDLTKY